jgi:hypothetical protein
MGKLSENNNRKTALFKRFFKGVVLYTHATSRSFVRHKLDNQSKAQHEVTYRMLTT